MNEPILSRELAFVAAQRGLDETTVLAQAVREGIRALYHDTIIEAYLSGRISREHALFDESTLHLSSAFRGYVRKLINDLGKVC